MLILAIFAPGLVSFMIIGMRNEGESLVPKEKYLLYVKYLLRWHSLVFYFQSYTELIVPFRPSIYIRVQWTNHCLCQNNMNLVEKFSCDDYKLLLYPNFKISTKYKVEILHVLFPLKVYSTSMAMLLTMLLSVALFDFKPTVQVSLLYSFSFFLPLYCSSTSTLNIAYARISITYFICQNFYLLPFNIFETLEEQ